MHKPQRIDTNHPFNQWKEIDQRGQLYNDNIPCYFSNQFSGISTENNLVFGFILKYSLVGGFHLSTCYNCRSNWTPRMNWFKLTWIWPYILIFCLKKIRISNENEIRSCLSLSWQHLSFIPIYVQILLYPRRTAVAFETIEHKAYRHNVQTLYTFYGLYHSISQEWNNPNWQWGIDGTIVKKEKNQFNK